MLIILVIAAGIGVSFTVIFNTESIAVENAAVRYSDEALIKASGIVAGDNMPSMNVNRIAKKIEKELPYIGHARIKREITGKVTIIAEYTHAAVCIPSVSGYVLLDPSGKVLETGVAEPADYIAEITGAEIENAEPGEKAVFTDEDMFTYITGLVSDFENTGFKNVTAIDFNDMNAVTAEIDYRVTVKLGSITKAASKLKFGKKVIDESLSNTSSGRLVVDLTQEGTAYVRSQENIDAANEAAEKALSGETETSAVPENVSEIPDAPEETPETSAAAEEPAEENRTEASPENENSGAPTYG